MRKGTKTRYRNRKTKSKKVDLNPNISIIKHILKWDWIKKERKKWDPTIYYLGETHLKYNGTDK